MIDNRKQGDETGFLLILKTSDGSFTEDALEIKQREFAQNAWSTSSAAMKFSSHGKIFLAFQNMLTSGSDGLKTTDDVNFDSKFRVMQYLQDSSSIDFIRQ